MKRRVFALVFTAAGVGSAVWAPGHCQSARPPGGHPVVIELFTSQGCSDCPPADKLLGELAARPDVIALSLPITYWDMLGWKDTLANDENTQRQKAYSKAMNRRGIYTPQIILDGVVNVVGNRRDEVLSAITERQSEDTRAVPVLVETSKDGVHIKIGGRYGYNPPPAGAGEAGEGQRDGVREGRHRGPINATVWVMRTLDHATVNIGSGENKDHALTYTNVVEDMVEAGQWTGGLASFDVDLPPLEPGAGVAVLVQENAYGQVVGAAQLRP